MRFKFPIPMFLCCFNLIAEVKEMNLKEGLIGALLFDDEKGDTAKGSSGHNLHAKFDKGIPKWSKGKFAGGLEFDGQSQASVPNNELMYLKSFTLTTWMNSPKTTDQWQVLAAKENRDDGGNRNYGLFAHINKGAMHYFHLWWLEILRW